MENIKAILNFGSDSYSHIEVDLGNAPSVDDYALIATAYTNLANILEANGINTNRKNVKQITQEITPQIPVQAPAYQAPVQAPVQNVAPPVQQPVPQYVPNTAPKNNVTSGVKILKGKEHLNDAPQWVSSGLHACSQCGNTKIFLNKGYSQKTNSNWYRQDCAECKNKEFINQPKGNAKPKWTPADEPSEPVDDIYEV